MTRSMLLLTLLIVATLAVAPATGADLLALDDDTPLTTEAAIAEYQSNGAVTVTAPQIMLNITVSKTRAKANASGKALPGSPSDAGTTYLCVDYDESIPRTVRFNVPAAYFAPQSTTLDASGEGPQAQLEPADNANATAVRIHFDGQTRACYEVDDVNGQISDVKRWGDDVVNRSFGFSLPGIGGSSGPAWQYPTPDTTENSSEMVIDRNETLTLQYDAAPNATDPTWLAVPDCSNPSEQIVCVIDRGPETVTLYAADGWPPIRYREQAGPAAGGISVPDITAGFRDAVRAFGEIPDFVNGLFGVMHYGG